MSAYMIKEQKNRTEQQIEKIMQHFPCIAILSGLKWKIPPDFSLFFLRYYIF